MSDFLRVLDEILALMRQAKGEAGHPGNSPSSHFQIQNLPTS